MIPLAYGLIRFSGPRKVFNLQYISDLHLRENMQLPVIPKTAQNLALLGDLGNPYSLKYYQLLKQASQGWNQVYLVAGNHEYWHKNLDEVNHHLARLCSQFKNVTYLNNSVAYLDGVKILGTTLWSHVASRAPSYGIHGDDVYLRHEGKTLTLKKLNSLHQDAVTFLDGNITDEPCVVLTHFLPSYECVLEKYKGGFYDKIQDRYASSLEFLIRPGVRYWAFGHTHARFIRVINGVPCGVNSSPVMG